MYILVLTERLTFSIHVHVIKSLRLSRLLLYLPQRSCRGVYWFHHVRPSVASPWHCWRCFSCWLFRLWCAGNKRLKEVSKWVVSVAGCLGYDVLVRKRFWKITKNIVSVAGCLGYDVLAPSSPSNTRKHTVSVAGCLGYDVLVRLSALYLVLENVSVAGCLGYDVLDCWADLLEP